MDYDYDHLGDGISRLKRTLSPFLRSAEMAAADEAAYPDWLEQGLALEERVCGFPPPDRADHLERAKAAGEICRGLRALDERIIPPGEAVALAFGLEDHLRQECEAMDRYMGIHTPHDLLYPNEGACAVPSPR